MELLAFGIVTPPESILLMLGLFSRYVFISVSNLFCDRELFKDVSLPIPRSEYSFSDSLCLLVACSPYYDSWLMSSYDTIISLITKSHDVVATTPDNVNANSVPTIPILFIITRVASICTSVSEYPVVISAFGMLDSQDFLVYLHNCS